ncbi:hypothetical protein GQS52_03885 [Streptomyces sp. SCUT-3]|nr:hypothetical protein GQS52_03885 [Streptomyces sp. SCUT-3]
MSSGTSGAVRTTRSWPILRYASRARATSARRPGGAVAASSGSTATCTSWTLPVQRSCAAARCTPGRAAASAA